MSITQIQLVENMIDAAVTDCAEWFVIERDGDVVNVRDWAPLNADGTIRPRRNFRGEPIRVNAYRLRVADFVIGAQEWAELTLRFSDVQEGHVLRAARLFQAGRWDSVEYGPEMLRTICELTTGAAENWRVLAG